MSTPTTRPTWRLPLEASNSLGLGKTLVRVNKTHYIITLSLSIDEHEDHMHVYPGEEALHEYLRTKAVTVEY